MFGLRKREFENADNVVWLLWTAFTSEIEEAAKKFGLGVNRSAIIHACAGSESAGKWGRRLEFDVVDFWYQGYRTLFEARLQWNFEKHNSLFLRVKFHRQRGRESERNWSGEFIDFFCKHHGMQEIQDHLASCSIIGVVSKR